MTDWVEIIALVAGPVLAVALTLWREAVRQQRERRMALLRQTLTSRFTPADPAFNVAINLIPVEFGKNNKVMAAWEEFSHAANNTSDGILTKEKLDTLLKVMMVEIGFGDRAAGQVQRGGYRSRAATNQDDLVSGVLKGVVSLAESSKASAKAAKAMAEHVTGQPLPSD